MTRTTQNSYDSLWFSGVSKNLELRSWTGSLLLWLGYYNDLP